VVLAVPWDDVVEVLTHLPPWQQQISDSIGFSGKTSTY
jgi:hypothetical protein